MSIVLGRKDKEWAENILGNSLIFTLILSGIVVTCTYLFMDRILLMFGATAETVSYAHEYMVWILPGMFMIFDGVIVHTSWRFLGKNESRTPAKNWPGS